MSLHKEIHFEDDICKHLVANGWLHAKDDAAQYNRELALFPPDVVNWLKDTQLRQWQQLEAHYGSEARVTEEVLTMLRNTASLSARVTINW